MKPGVYKNTELSNEDYHAHKDSISRSALMLFSDSPYKYWARYRNPSAPKTTSSSAMKLGSAFHDFILEPELFEQKYIIKPERIYKKDGDIEAYEKYKLLLEEYAISKKITLDDDEYQTLCAMKESLSKNKKAMNLLLDGRVEHSFFWNDSESKLLCKVRPDVLHDDIIVDLKTISDASPQNYQRSMITGGYHIQGAMVRTGVECIEGNRIDTVINVCVETTYPYSVGIYFIDQAALDYAEEKFKKILGDISFAFTHNHYQDYEVQTIGIPKWAI